jgi:hypothetical protein
MADTYGKTSSAANNPAPTVIPDQWIRIQVDFDPDIVLDPPIHVAYEFQGKNPIERDCPDLSGHPDIDVDDAWEPTGAIVDGTHVALNALAIQFMLASGHEVTAAYTTNISPVTPPPPPQKQKKVLCAMARDNTRIAAVHFINPELFPES